MHVFDEDGKFAFVDRGVRTCLVMFNVLAQ